MDLSYHFINTSLWNISEKYTFSHWYSSSAILENKQRIKLKLVTEQQIY